MTSIHRQIFDLLLPVCLTTTQQMRDKYEPKKLQEDAKDQEQEKPKEIPELCSLIAKSSPTNFNTNNVAFILALHGYSNKQIKDFIQTHYSDHLNINIFNILEGIGEESKIFYEPFTVIVLGAKTSQNNHLYPLNTPLLVYNGKSRRCLHPNGKVDNTSYNNLYDQVRLATDEEVEQCLEKLNMMQQRTIMNNELYAPYIASMFVDPATEQGDLVVDKENNSSSDDSEE
jgi:hypothetical protein